MGQGAAGWSAATNATGVNALTRVSGQETTPLAPKAGSKAQECYGGQTARVVLGRLTPLYGWPIFTPTRHGWKGLAVFRLLGGRAGILRRPQPWEV